MIETVGQASSEEFSKTSKDPPLNKQKIDIKVQSHKKTIRHTVRAKKLDERQLFKFLKSLDESKTKRLLQIDKEVSEVEQTLNKLLADQSETALSKRAPTKGSYATVESLKTSDKKKKRRAKHGRPSDLPGGPHYHEHHERIKTSTKRVDKLLDSYYRFDEVGNRLQTTPVLSSADTSERTSEGVARVAWDISDFSPSELRIFSASDSGSENASRRGSKTPRSPSPDKINHLHQRKLASRPSVSSKGRRDYDIVTSQSVDNQFTDVDHRESQKSPENNRRLLVSPQRNVIRKSGIIKVPALFVEELSSTPVSKETESSDGFPLTDESEDDVPITEYQKPTPGSQLPERFDIDSDLSFSPMEESNKSTHSCQVPDCIFHNRVVKDTPTEGPDLLTAYYRTSVNSRAKQTGTPLILPIFQSPGDLSRDVRSARRPPLSPPSPTPSEIIRDIIYTPKSSHHEMNNAADLDVVRSVRRPMKGSNREQMLRDKEANVRHTFDLMRQKMSAKVPPDFNTNYGTPTPNWKILNPLKLRHKINHSSPLHRMWKQ